MKVKDIMKTKVITVSPEVSVARAAEIMREHKIGCLPVLENNRLVGIITSHDLRCTHPNRLVADAMTTSLITTHPDSTWQEAAELFVRHNIERLLIADNGRFTGILTRTDLLASLVYKVDPLTKLPKANYLIEKGTSLLASSLHVGMIFIDLDNFGQIDKELGHVRADEILIQFADKIASLTDSRYDYFGRYAGDEFLIICARKGRHVFELANKLVEQMTTCQWLHDVKLSASLGLTCSCLFERQVKDPEYQIKELINQASLASSAAKKKKEHVVNKMPCYKN